MDEKKLSLEEIAKQKRANRKRPTQTHKTESPKAKSKTASKTFREKNDVLSVTLPKGFNTFLEEMAAKPSIRKETKLSIFQKYLEQSDALKDFLKWQEEKDG